MNGGRASKIAERGDNPATPPPVDNCPGGTECPGGCCPEAGDWFCCPDGLYCAATAEDCP